jgi:hypothetical protein
MKYLKKRRAISDTAFRDEDPLNGLANLLDLALVFITGVSITLFSSYRLQDLLREKSDLTVMRKTESGELEILTKKGKEIKAMRVSRIEAAGRGERLGTAYRLEDGTMIYVPE